MHLNNIENKIMWCVVVSFFIFIIVVGIGTNVILTELSRVT